MKGLGVLLVAVLIAALAAISCGDGRDSLVGPRGDGLTSADVLAEFSTGDPSGKATTALNFAIRMTDAFGPVYSGVADTDTVLVYSTVGKRYLLAASTAVPDTTGVLWAGITVFPGDFNRDLRVSMDDFFVFADSFGKTVGSLDLTSRPLDMDADGRVGLADFFQFVDFFGLQPATAKPVIEDVDALRSRVASLSGEMRVVGEALLLTITGEKSLPDAISEVATKTGHVGPAGKVAASVWPTTGVVPLRINILGGRRYVAVDTTVTRDWIAVSKYYKDTAPVAGDVTVIDGIRTAPRVSQDVSGSMVAGAGSVEKVRLANIFSDDSRMQYSVVGALPTGVQLNGNLLEISFADSSGADYRFTVRATDQDGLMSDFPISLRRAAVRATTELVFPDTVRIGDTLVPEVKKVVFWDSEIKSETKTVDTSSALIGAPTTQSQPGSYTLVLLRPEGAISKTITVYPAVSRDYIRVDRFSSDVSANKVSIRIETGLSAVRVEVALNGNKIYDSTVAVQGDSIGLVVPAAYVGNTANELSLTVSDNFGRREVRSLSVVVGDTVPPKVWILGRTPEGPIGIYPSGRILWGVKAVDNTAINPSWSRVLTADALTVSAVVGGSVVRTSGFNLQPSNGDTVDAWGYLELSPVSSGREVRVLFKVVDLAGNEATADTLLYQPALSIGASAIPAGSPEISVSPVSISVASQVGMSATRLVTVANSGTAVLSVSSVSVSGAGFLVAPGSMFISPGASQNITVTFAPASAGVVSGNLRIVSDDSDEGVVNIPLVGTGTFAPAGNWPAISVSPASIAFGDTTIGATKTRSFVVSNTGNANLVVSSVSTTNGVFLPVPTSFTVAPGGAQTVVVTFAPTSAMVYGATVGISSNDPNNPSFSLGVSGGGVNPGAVGAPEISVAPMSLALTSQVQSSTSGQVTVSNVGTANLSIHSATIAGVGPELVVNPTSATVAPGSSVALVVTFSPTIVGTMSRVLTITSNDVDEGTVSVPITAQATPAPGGTIGLSSSSLSFGNVGVGQSAVRVFNVSNTGTVDLSVRMPISSSAFSVTPGDTSYVLSSGSQRSVVVTFAPTQGIGYSGAFNIASDDPINPLLVVSCSGSGVESHLTLITQSLDFGNVMVSGTSVQKIEFRNTGNQTLSGVVGTSNAVFGLSATSVSVAPGASDSIFVTFAPVANQPYSAVIQFATDGGNLSVPVDGTGTAAALPNIVSATINGTLYQAGDDFTVIIPAGAIPVSCVAQNTTSIKWERIYYSGLTLVEETVLNGASGSFDPYAGGITSVVRLKITATGPGGSDVLRINLSRVGAP